MHKGILYSSENEGTSHMYTNGDGSQNYYSRKINETYIQSDSICINI